MAVPVDRTDAPLLGEPLPVELMNTIWADRAGVHDALATPRDVVAWLRSVSAAAGARSSDVEGWSRHASHQELEAFAGELRTLRDALRRLAASQTGDARDRAASALTDLDTAVSLVNEASAGAPRWSELEWRADGEPRSRTATDADLSATIAGTIASEAIGLFASDIRHDLKACLAPGCVLYFVKQHTRRGWCSTACGNRARAARHYQRHRTEA